MVAHSAPGHGVAALLVGAALAVAGCSGGKVTSACTPPVATRLPTAAAVHDTATTPASQYLTFAVTAGTRYSAALVGPGDSATSLSVYADRCFEALLTSAGGGPPVEAIVTPTDSVLRAKVTPGSGAGLPIRRVILVYPVPSPASPQAETASVVAESPTVGQVASRQTSLYTARSLLSGGTYTISITAMTGDAILHVYTDSTRSMQLACTQNYMGINQPQECTTSLTGQTVYLSVSSGPLNRTGARYLVLVSRI